MQKDKGKIMRLFRQKIYERIHLHHTFSLGNTQESSLSQREICQTRTEIGRKE